MMLFGRVLIGIASALVSLRYSLGLYAWRLSEGLERPSYSVVERLPDGVEIRQYEPYCVAEATMKNTPMKKATGNGFRACAGYIFGKKNRVKTGFLSFRSTESRSMAMTAPVRMETSERATKVSFVMASNESLASLPTPTDSVMSLRQIPAHTAAFVKFSGPPPSEARVAKERARIEKALAASGYAASAAAETLLYGYHDPFATPNLLRRNEVGVFVSGKGSLV
mmetsp:Transcript_10537/g.31453  ORF Transcript_10537/g.31453 Transcript_10537/m.31453 type:complete len:224 (-) Transcript_10537:19-690(-)